MQVELNNTTKKLCVIGDPVLHSKSPLIQNTMIQTLGLDYIYLCQPVKAGEAARWLEWSGTGEAGRDRRLAAAGEGSGICRLQRHHASQGGPPLPHG